MPLDALPHCSVLLDDTATCTWNGQQLCLRLGDVGYEGQRTLYSVPACVLEVGHVYGLVGPNGIGKSTFGQLLASRTIPNFPTGLSVTFVDACSPVTRANLHPVEYVQCGVDRRLGELQRRIDVLERKLEEGEANTDGDDIGSIGERLGLLCEQEDELRAATAGDAERVLEELGFGREGMMDKRVGELSNGWRYKCDVARALTARSDLLVLDEPSFLDEGSLAWLCERLREVARRGGLVLLISHKERVLESVCDRVLYIGPARRMETYNCGWEAFRAAQEEKTLHAGREVEKGRAKQADADQALRRAKQRLAKGEKRHAELLANRRVDPRFVKGKSKEAKQKGGRSLAAKTKLLERQAADLVELAHQSRRYQTCPLSLTGRPASPDELLLSVQDVSFAYTKCAPVLTRISVAVYGNDRIALLGPNGSGKSTLVNLLAGKLEPTTGAITGRDRIRIAYFPQDALARLVVECGGCTAVSIAQSRSGLGSVEARNHLAMFGLKGEDATTPVRQLSAGQRTRLYFALEFPPGSSASLLVLDEVENLDMDTANALLDSLSSFAGAVICVTHDSDHLDRVRPRQVWRMDNGAISVSSTQSI